jgi:hypothetical protein
MNRCVVVVRGGIEGVTMKLAMELAVHCRVPLAACNCKWGELLGKLTSPIVIGSLLELWSGTR